MIQNDPSITGAAGASGDRVVDADISQDSLGSSAPDDFPAKPDPTTYSGDGEFNAGGVTTFDIGADVEFRDNPSGSGPPLEAVLVAKIEAENAEPADFAVQVIETNVNSVFNSISNSIPSSLRIRFAGLINSFDDIAPIELNMTEVGSDIESAAFVPFSPLILPNNEGVVEAVESSPDIEIDFVFNRGGGGRVGEALRSITGSNRESVTVSIPVDSLVNYVDVDVGNCIERNQEIVDLGEDVTPPGDVRSATESVISNLEDTSNRIVNTFSDATSIEDVSAEISGILSSVQSGDAPSSLSQAVNDLQSSTSDIQETFEEGVDQRTRLTDEREKFLDFARRFRGQVDQPCAEEVLNETIGGEKQAYEQYYGVALDQSDKASIKGELSDQTEQLSKYVDELRSILNNLEGADVPDGRVGGCVLEQDAPSVNNSLAQLESVTVERQDFPPSTDRLSELKTEANMLGGEIEQKLDRDDPCYEAAMSRLETIESQLDVGVELSCSDIDPGLRSSVESFRSELGSLSFPIEQDRVDELRSEADSLSSRVSSEVSDENPCKAELVSKIESGRTKLSKGRSFDAGKDPCGERYPDLDERIQTLANEVNGISRASVDPEGQIQAARSDYQSVEGIMDDIRSVSQTVANRVSDEDSECLDEFTSRLNATANNAEQLLLGVNVDENALGEIQQRREQTIGDLRSRLQSL